MLASSSGPLVRGKELEHVKLLKPRKFHVRLDIGPFYGIYAMLVLLSYRFFVLDEWSNFKYISYSCGAAAILHIFTFLFSQWSVRVRALVGYYTVRDVEQAQMVLAIPGKFSGTKELVPLVKKVLASESTQYSFEFRKHKFVYDSQEHAFQKQEFPVQEPFAYYNGATGYGTEARVAAAVDMWGLNEFEVPLPPFINLLKEQMLAPFFVFQVFCVALWCIDEYWYYSLFTLFMLITFECTVVSQRLRNLTELRSLQTPRQPLPVYRNGRWDTIPGENLLPGDIISIGRPTAGPGSDEMVVPADCLLLGGSCIVEEAVLTGESTPQWKVPIMGVNEAERLDIARHKQYILFGGTKILQHTGDKGARLKTPDGGCLAVVLRTGFETSQGQLMRTILYSTERVTANNLETGLFILFLLCFAVTASYYVLVNGLADPTRNRFKLALNCIMIITSVIPPELPMELSIAVNTSLVALAKKAVFCTEPFRIPFAGKVEVCCFDKTGTLTSDHLLLDGVAAPDGVCECEGDVSERVVRDMKEVGGDTARVMAGCHSLVLLGEEVIGDPLEKASLEAVRWSYSSDVSVSPDKKVRTTIIARHHFSSDLKRMSTIVRIEDDNAAAGEIRYAALLKGAPEVVAGILDAIPPGYDTMYRKLAAQGGRVISLAYCALPTDVDMSALRAASREELEGRGGFRFVGFAVFNCPLKEESEPALEQLEESSHQLMMITGDSPLTACHAASKVHIVTRDVLLLDHINPDNAPSLPPPAADSSSSSSPSPPPPTINDDKSYRWSSPDASTIIPFSRSWPDILQLAASFDLCISGDSLSYLEAIGIAAKVIPLAQVYARVSPEQKELVVKTLRAAGHVVLMCGDGTNDVGGLKAAHIGVALLNVKEQKKGKGKDAKKKAPKKKSAGQKQLEEWSKSGREVTPQMEKIAAWLDKMETSVGDADAPMLKPGDASMASAFTAKATGVAPVLDIIKQGRCTLVTTVQMFKILGLLCLSTAYSLSVMYLQGVKLSDVQATLSGFLTAGMFFFISNAKPLDRLSTTRPHPNIFSVYFFSSLIGQFALHMTFLVFMYHHALAQMPEEQRQDSDSEFKPNLVNTVCYLVQAVVQLSTFAANYVGHPFNTSLMDNKPMFTSLKYSFLFLTAVGLDLVPGLASSFSLVPIPQLMKAQLLLGSLITFFGCYWWEQMLRNALPPATPPHKGYLWHERELKQMGALEAKKRQ